MKTHRPWQPHFSQNPLFNPYVPTGQSTTLDHFDLREEEEESEDEIEDVSKEDAISPSVIRRD